MKLPRGVGLLLRLAVSGLLLFWLGHNFRDALTELQRLRPVDLLPAAGLFALSTILGAIQWSWVMHQAGVLTPKPRLHQLYWIGLFANNFLPSNVGGDILKVADVAMREGGMARPMAATLLDRVFGLLALLLLAGMAGLALGGPTPAGVPWYWLGLCFLPVAGLGAMLLSRRLGNLVTKVAETLPGALGQKFGQVLSELQAFRMQPGFLLRVLLLALLVQVVRISTHVAVADVMGIELSGTRILELYVLIPLLGIAIVLPLSFNGVGLREAVASRLLPAIGIDATTAVALQLATFVVQLAVSALGGLLFAWQWGRGRLMSRSPE